MSRAFLHKSKTAGFGNVAAKRQDNMTSLRNQRQSRRLDDFNKRRGIDQENEESFENNVKPTVENDKLKREVERRNALKKFLEEKEAKKAATKKNKRPPFIVGIVHHGSSPVLKDLSNKQEKTKGAKVTKVEVRHQQRVTRATSKPGVKPKPETTTNNKLCNGFQMFPFPKTKSVFSFQMKNKPLTEPHTPEVLKRSTQKGTLPLKNTNMRAPPQKKALFPKKAEARTLPHKLRTTTRSHRPQQDGNSSTEEENLVPAPEYMKETPVKVERDEDTSSMELSVEPSTSAILNTSFIEEVEVKPENSEAARQRNRLQEETERLMALAEKWQQLSQAENLPQDIVDEVDSVVGQTKLLTRDKFMQFSRLIAEHETTPLRVTADDLDGFWDMIYLQVSNLVIKYEKLDTLKENNWKLPSPPKKSKGKKKIVKRSNIPTENPIEEVKISRKSGGTTPVQAARRSRSYSPSPYIAMRISNDARSLGLATTSATPVQASLPTPSVATTPRNLLINKIKSEINLSIVKDEAVESTPEMNASVINNLETSKLLSSVTPRRSIRLAHRQPTPINKLCSTCFSPECNDRGCMTNVSTSEARKASGRKFMLKPSQLVVPEAVSVEAPSPSVRSRKSRRVTVLDTTDAVSGEAPSSSVKGRKSRRATVFDLTEDVTSTRHSTRSRRVTFDP